MGYPNPGQQGQWGPQQGPQQGWGQQPPQGPPPGYGPPQQGGYGPPPGGGGYGPPPGQPGGYGPPGQPQGQGGWGGPPEPSWGEMYDLGDPGAGAGYTPGRWPFVVAESSYGLTNDGDKWMWTLKLQFTDGPHANGKITAYRAVSHYQKDGRTPNTSGISILYSELRALGIPVGEKYGDPQGMVGFWAQGPKVNGWPQQAFTGQQVSDALPGRNGIVLVENDDRGGKAKRIYPPSGQTGPTGGPPAQPPGPPGMAPPPGPPPGPPGQPAMGGYQPGPPAGVPPQPGQWGGGPPQGPPQPVGGQGPAGMAAAPGGGMAPAGPGGYPQQGPPAPATQAGGMAEFGQGTTWNPGQQQGPPPQQAPQAGPPAQPPWPANGAQQGQAPPQQAPQGPPQQGQQGGPPAQPWGQ